jgi:hypothetical protein
MAASAWSAAHNPFTTASPRRLEQAEQQSSVATSVAENVWS